MNVNKTETATSGIPETIVESHFTKKIKFNR